MPRSVVSRDQIMTPETVRPFDPWRYLCANVEEMLNQAQKVREQAQTADEASSRKSRISHRGFYVGVAALSCVMQDGVLRKTETQFSTNTMPRPAGSERVCGESRVLKGLRKRALKEGNGLIIPGLVVIGEAQPDRATGLATETLFPCGETCWPNFFDMDKPMVDTVDADTLIITTRPDAHLRKGQVQTAHELHNFYAVSLDGGNPAEPPLFSRTVESWQGIVGYYDSLVPANFNPLESPEARGRAVEAARAAIRGFEQRPQLYLV